MKRAGSILFAALAALAALPASALDAQSPYRLKFMEYIEATNRVAYFDTEYVPNENIEIEMEFAFVETNSNLKCNVFGVYGSSGMRFQFAYGPENCTFGFGLYDNFDTAVTGFPYNTERHIVKYVTNVGFFFDGTKVVPHEGIDLTTWGGKWNWDRSGSGQSLYLCACNPNGGTPKAELISQLRIYSCKIWDNGVLVRNFMPAQTEKTRAVLYDTVRRKIHYSLGSNNWCFIPGGEEVVVNDYREAKYIEADRTAYINTGYTPNANTELEMAFSFTTNIEKKTYVFGEYGTSGGRFQFSYGPASTGCFLGYGNTYTNSYVLPFDNYYNTNRHVVTYVPGSGKGFYFDGDRINPPKTTLTTWSGTGAKLLLGQTNPNNKDELNPTNLAPIRIYSCKIWENGTPKRNLVPKQRVLDGKNGLYDTVTGYFYAYYGDKADFTAELLPGLMLIIW